jgi:hypothetical protein
MGDVVDISDRHPEYLSDKEAQKLIAKLDTAIAEFDAIMRG